MEQVITARGDVTIRVMDESGAVLETREIRNLVMQIGKTILAKRLANDAAYANAYIDRISFGTSNAAAVDTQLDLQGVIATPAAAITVAYPAYNSVKFSSTLLANEGGSNTYQEIGLFGADEKMFSRVVIAAITKSTAYQIAVDWTISFQ